MNNPIIQLLILAGIAVFLILRLRSVLGTRDGFEQDMTRPQPEGQNSAPAPEFEVIEGGSDRDITDHVGEDSDEAQALTAMKRVEPGFSVSEFMSGAGQAYEMILMAYEKGELSQIRDFVDSEIYDAFAEAVESRRDAGISIEAEFIGLRERTIEEVTFNTNTNEGEITMRFVGELSSTVRDKGGDVIEAESSPLKKTKDSWTFARTMGGDDPNWMLVATGG
ncbi:MAG: Tim44/TimA family putative adaptor protein [Rhodobacteraceae bacterium]|nr:Tim44/TimA family putative adaptor protein [Paracoccaceae bacterium]